MMSQIILGQKKLNARSEDGFFGREASLCAQLF